MKLSKYKLRDVKSLLTLTIKTELKENPKEEGC